MGKLGFRIANGIVHAGFWLSSLFLIVFWSRIPEEIVTHFNGDGAADGWGRKSSMILIVFVMVYIYAMHLICMKVIQYLSTREKMYGKKLAACVTDEDFADGILMTRAYLAWTDASLILMFDYIILCSALLRPLGGWFIWAVFLAIGGELVWYFACYLKKKRQIRVRMFAELSAHEDEAEKTVDDMYDIIWFWNFTKNCWENIGQ